MKLFLDWSGYQNAGMGDAYADIPKSGGDFAKAVAVCIGSRQCEQFDKGVMCPSFKVTGNPALSPGGRVKLLKTALNAADDKALFDAELAEAMSLCVSCKGCKRECENEVDMALIKAEYLAQRRQADGLSLRHILWAHLPKLLCWPPVRKLVIWRNRYGWLARIVERLLGIAAQAPLPVPAEHDSREKPVAENAFYPESTTPVREVVLFVDTFNLHFNPAVAEAAVNLLNAAGYSVQIAGADENNPTSLCCGRTYFSNGMIDQARNEATRLLQALRPHIDAGRWIVGLEPSCILSLRDEYLKLGLGETAAKLAERVLLLEEFIAREQTGKRWPLAFKTGGERVLVHGHCHQKAVGAMKAMRKVLKTVDGLDFELIESSCCGMAGHFGLEAEHYADSQAMAELALFPALRAEPQAAIVANGFSCQQQINNGGFSKPKHIAEILYAAITVKQKLDRDLP
ncbi:(Fe-S)-binding protein [Methylobacter sp.]|uniref:(Fe-S)-binding protein n=1 Tax=Methylobacter sp. TaxID=2051955 RepID=UPI002FDDDDBA